jgi:hypothetical protein
VQHAILKKGVYGMDDASLTLLRSERGVAGTLQPKKKQATTATAARTSATTTASSN